jgi:hypothetical protein
MSDRASKALADASLLGKPRTYDSPLHMSSTSLLAKIPRSTVSISLITVGGERFTLPIETKHLPRHDTKDIDAFDVPGELLKAILWSRWQGDWGLQPPNPSSIKLIHFGQTINESTPLRCILSRFR